MIQNYCKALCQAVQNQGAYITISRHSDRNVTKKMSLLKRELYSLCKSLHIWNIFSSCDPVWHDLKSVPTPPLAIFSWNLPWSAILMISLSWRIMSKSEEDQNWQWHWSGITTTFEPQHNFPRLKYPERMFTALSQKSVLTWNMSPVDVKENCDVIVACASYILMSTCNDSWAESMFFYTESIVVLQ